VLDTMIYLVSSVGAHVKLRDVNVNRRFSASSQAVYSYFVILDGPCNSESVMQ
jgi:hypothetical protein